MSKTATATQATTTGACPHPEAAGTRWGDRISPERQAELQDYLDRWAAETDHGERRGPFDVGPPSRILIPDPFGDQPLELTGADVFWLAVQALTGVERIETNSRAEAELLAVRDGHPMLRSVELSALQLEGARLPLAHLEASVLVGAHLEWADLLGAHLESAYLPEAHLEGTNLSEARLDGADLSESHLEGTRLEGTYLGHANLRNAWMDKTTALIHSVLDRASLDQLSFDGTNLAVVKWEAVRVLGDEVRASATKDADGNRKARWVRLADNEAAVRAHLQLSAALRSQGMRDQADRFAYRAQILQRRLLRLRRRYGAALGSWLLDLISGYGYRPIRSFITYLIVVGAFALTYYLLGNSVNPPLDPLSAVVFSITSFHGRGFAPGENVMLNNPLTVIAAGEAIIGLLIEITFIATFTQRFFAR